MSMDNMITTLYPVVQDLTSAEYGCSCCDDDVLTATLCNYSLEELATPVTTPRQLPEVELSPTFSSVSSSSSTSSLQRLASDKKRETPGGNDLLLQLPNRVRVLNEKHRRRHSVVGIEHGSNMLDNDDASSFHRRIQSSPAKVSSPNRDVVSVQTFANFQDDLTESQNSTTAISKFDESYVLARQILRCNVSTVWECIHRDSGLRYCVKIVDRRRFTSHSDESSTLREIGILRELQEQPCQTSTTPRWVELVDVSWRDPHLLYIVTKNVPHGNLLTRLHQLEQSKDRLSESFVKNMAKSILEGVESLHALSICHHDLKPEHILLLNDAGEVQICDFGSAIQLDGLNEHGSEFYSCSCHRSSNSRIRKIFEGEGAQQQQYSAPEILGGKAHGTISDLWSIGVILYYCLSGKLPFSLENSARPSTAVPAAVDASLGNTSIGSWRSLRERIMNAQYSFSDRDWNSVSRPAKQLISNLLHADPQVRVTATEALEHAWFADLTRESSSLSLGSSQTQGKTSRPFFLQRLWRSLSPSITKSKHVDDCLEGSVATAPSAISYTEASYLRPRPPI